MKNKFWAIGYSFHDGGTKLAGIKLLKPGSTVSMKLPPKPGNYSVVLQ